MRFKSIASLATFVAVAVAQVQLEDSAHLFQPDGAVGACGNPIQDSDLANNGTFCGLTIPVMMAKAPNTVVNVTVQDLCTTCVEKQIELTPSGFHALIGISPNNTIKVFYILPHK
ncbi:hypothetical protein FB451DRAFT_1416781 [Mycena latifolia]|nr:hypothetical protein FB451DRAFT_1416781 [Mycena latifolia]